MELVAERDEGNQWTSVEGLTLRYQGCDNGLHVESAGAEVESEHDASGRVCGQFDSTGSGKTVLGLQKGMLGTTRRFDHADEKGSTPKVITASNCR